MFLKIPEEWYVIRRELKKEALKAVKNRKTRRALVDYMIVGAEYKVRQEPFESHYKFRVRYAMFLGWLIGKEEGDGR